MAVENNSLEVWMRWEIYVRKSSARKLSEQILLVTGKCSSFRGGTVYCGLIGPQYFRQQDQDVGKDFFQLGALWYTTTQQFKMHIQLCSYIVEVRRWQSLLTVEIANSIANPNTRVVKNIMNMHLSVYF